MTAATIELGGNALTAVLGLITLATLIVNNLTTRRGTAAAESAAAAATDAAAELKNNGGSTALDKLQEGQRLLHEEVKALALRVDSIDARDTPATAAQV